MNDNVTAVLLVAAGLSSRMGAFKPLLGLDGKSLIDHTLETFVSIKAGYTVIVTGYKSEEIKRHLKGSGVTFIYNQRYAKTEMFESVKLGLKYLHGKCGRIFLCPADIPLVRQFTVEEMHVVMLTRSIGVLKPSYRGKGGHPLLIDTKCIPKILSYKGANGLKGALDNGGFNVCTLPMPDPAILVDADTSENMTEMKKYYKTMDIPSGELSLEILKYRNAGEAVINHSVAVATLAEKLAFRALDRGFPVSLRLVEAGALLHDVERKSGSDHAEKGSSLLKKMGFPKVADIVGTHMDLPAEAIAQMDERAIVYLADKLTCGEEQTSIRMHMEKVLERFALDGNAVAAIKKRMGDARMVMERLGLDDTGSLSI